MVDPVCRRGAASDRGIALLGWLLVLWLALVALTPLAMVVAALW